MFDIRFVRESFSAKSLEGKTKMSATMEKLSSNQVKLTVTVSAEEFDKAMNTAYGKLKGRLSVPGFRKGKAPRKVIENYYGAGVLVEEAFNTVLPESYDKAVEETGAKPSLSRRSISNRSARARIASTPRLFTFVPK